LESLIFQLKAEAAFLSKVRLGAMSKLLLIAYFFKEISLWQSAEALMVRTIIKTAFAWPQLFSRQIISRDLPLFLQPSS
jgi:hypothetical protein